MLPPRTVGLDWFCARVAAREPTTFSRWGDGEWTAVLGRRRHGQNCDGHRFFPAMGGELKQVLLARPDHPLGLQSLALRVLPEVPDWIAQNYLTDLDWVDADVFHHASGRGELGRLVAELRKVPVVLVGPPHLHRPLKDVLGYAEHVIVPPQNCYLALKDLATATLGALERLPAGAVAAISASMPAKLLVAALHKKVGRRHSLIDFGSVWDFYAGVRSRGYMRAMAQGGRDGTAELRGEDAGRPGQDARPAEVEGDGRGRAVEEGGPPAQDDGEAGGQGRGP